MDVGSILIGVSSGSVVSTAVKAWLDRRKMGADTASVLTKAATELVEAQAEVIVKPLRERIAELEDDLARVEVKARHLEQRLDRCQADNRAKDRVIAQLMGRGVTSGDPGD